MKKTLSLLGLPLLIGALALPVMAQEAPATGAPVAAPEKGTGTHKGERHPYIRESIQKLKTVREVLTKDAAHDSEGHRAKAVDAIDKALQELHECMLVDTK